MLRLNITASFEALICILLDVAETTAHVKVCVVNCLHTFHQLRTIRVVFNDALPVAHLKQLLPITVQKT